MLTVNEVPLAGPENNVAVPVPSQLSEKVGAVYVSVTAQSAPPSLLVVSAMLDGQFTSVGFVLSVTVTVNVQLVSTVFPATSV